MFRWVDKVVGARADSGSIVRGRYRKYQITAWIPGLVHAECKRYSIPHCCAAKFVSPERWT
jgi:hypothetical protein